MSPRPWPLLLLGLCAATAAAEPGPWEQIRDEQGIRVAKRKVDGSPLAEFQGRGLVEAPVARLVAVISDAGRRTEWMAKCVASQRVARVDETSEISYNRTQGSWPVADRDVVLRGKIVFEPAARRIRLTFDSVTDERMPPQRGVVRMPFLRGHWLLEPRGEGQTFVEYQVHANPGGAIPNWLANLVAKQLPFKTIVALRVQAQRASYPEIEARLAGLPGFPEVMGRRKEAAVLPDAVDGGAPSDGGAR